MAILALTPGRGLQKVDSAMAQVTTDHNTIREWVEKKGGEPAAVKRTHQGGDVGIIRIMFPDRPRSEHEALEEISWDEFFWQFDKSKLALLYEERHPSPDLRAGRTELLSDLLPAFGLVGEREFSAAIRHRR